jgi:Na+-driven multidrug efflux pump
MARIGVPNSLESTLVQAGYLLANTMIVGLGTHQAAVYQVTNTLYGFASYPQSLCGPILISFVGQALGAGDVPKAKKTLMGIYAAGMTVSLVLSLVIALCVNPLADIYTDSTEVIADCRVAIWYMFAMCIPAMSINGMDPGLRAGGDSKWIMIYTIFAVWAIRVPLTWLFCYRMDMGVPGLFLANILSLVFRALCSQFRFHTGKWLHDKL